MLPVKTQRPGRLQLFYKSFTLMALALTLAFPEMCAQPVINGFAPASGPVGTSVFISGSGFHHIADSNIVYFGAIRASVVSASNVGLTVIVPHGATYQLISVTSGKL